ncbi:hypothetical protein PhCBS80983_g06440 [Powellomyces hirtus]|uniref:Uncharacterized protein n=1 Tax=Powellomyces hirtus TaxID=109895 RepID=A0A507DN61_9FUNG|nr:hypothetical protein PhCBS80983_g06440 [Powellomyces hirtus]
MYGEYLYSSLRQRTYNIQPRRIEAFKILSVSFLQDWDLVEKGVNDKIAFAEQGSDTVRYATIPTGNYSIVNFGDAIASALTAASGAGNTYEVSYSPVSRRLTVSTSGVNFKILEGYRGTSSYVLTGMLSRYETGYGKSLTLKNPVNLSGSYPVLLTSNISVKGQTYLTDYTDPAQSVVASMTSDSFGDIVTWTNNGGEYLPVEETVTRMEVHLINSLTESSANEESVEESQPVQDTEQQLEQKLEEPEAATPAPAAQKKPRSPAQIAAMKKATETRAKNLREMQARKKKEDAVLEKQRKIDEAERILKKEKEERKIKREARKKALEEKQKRKPVAKPAAKPVAKPVAKPKPKPKRASTPPSAGMTYVEFDQSESESDDYGASVPRNWIFASNTFSRAYTDPRGEGWSVYSPIGQSEYSTKSRNLTPIKISCDSNSDGAPTSGAGLVNTKLGMESIIQSLTIKAANEVLTKIDNYPAYLALTYRNLNKGHKQLLQNMSGYGTSNVFSATHTASVSFHPMVGCFHPSNDQFFPVWALPNQALTIEIVLADPSTVFTSGNVNELKVSNIRCLIPYVTPPPSVVYNVTRAIADGKSIFYDYVRSTQTENACSGGQRNTFNLHMSGVRSLVGIECCFVDDDVLSDPTKDKSEMFSLQNLRSWRLLLGPNAVIPAGAQGFSHGPFDRTTLLVSQLSNNDFDQMADMDISFADYDQKYFSLSYGFQSKDEG